MVNTFLLGWAVTIASGLAAYPIDTIKRRMMMTAGQEVSILPSTLGYSDFHNVMGFTSKKMPNNILKNVC
jgi:hypothetical protein